MALTPVDFAAYSRATGVPVPEDPEERAALAPEVLEFRRNQLRQPQQESNLPGILGAAALGLSALGAGVYGLTRLAGRGRQQGAPVFRAPQSTDLATVQKTVVPEPKQYATVKPSFEPPATAIPQSTVDLSNAQATSSERMIRRHGRMVPVSSVSRTPRGISQATQERPTGVVQTDLSAIDKWLEDSSLLSEVEAEQAIASLTPKELSEFRGAESKARNEYRGLITAIGDEAIAQDRAAAAQEFLTSQTIGALESGEDQITARVMRGVQRNEDLDASQVNDVARQTNSVEVAASMTPDGLPVDQAEGLTVLDLNKKEAIRIPPRALSQEESEDLLKSLLRDARLATEVDTEYDYSAENRRQAAQVRDRIQRAQDLQNQATQIINEARAGEPLDMSDADPELFAKSFNKQYREELNDKLRLVDNARQRAELAATEADEVAQDLESLLVGERSPIDKNMRGRELRGGKPNIEGDIVYQDAAGNFASADTGTVKKRQKRGPEFKAKAEALNRLYTASDQDLAYIIDKTRQARQNNQPLTQLENDTARMASQVLSKRAINNPEPTQLQLNELDRVTASIAASQSRLREARNARPTISSGPAQDVARAMETLRRGMVVEPSEEIPTYPSVQTLRTGYVSDEPGDIGPILGALDVYTGAAAEAAGPVIFTGKSKANSVIQGPPITGTVLTSVGRYLTQDNPDVLGTVYNVAGTPANRAISAQVEKNAQNFLADAIAGGLTTKTVAQVEPYRTPGTYGVIQRSLLTPSLSQKGLLPLQQSLGLTGPEPSQRTLYAQYQPGRSVPVPLSPFIGEMSGGTVIATPQTTEIPITRRDIGAPARSIDLTRRGGKARYYNDDPAYPTYVTSMEPAPIGPLTQSPGLSRIGGLYETPVLGAGNVPILELTTRGQKISYPRMAKAAEVPTYKGFYQGSFYGPQGTISNVPRYGIDPGGDWQKDLMRSAYRRGGPIRTYQG